MIEKAVTIKLEPREDGGLRVSSDDLPGLILSGADPYKTVCAIWPAITLLSKHMQRTDGERSGKESTT